MATPLNSIQVPEEFVELAGGWYQDMDMLYAISSTGNLTMGSRRPWSPDGYVSDEMWYWGLFSDLATDLRHLLRLLEKNESDHEDKPMLQAFYDWADATADRLAAEYELEL